jgi:hypothetical protein
VLEPPEPDASALGGRLIGVAPHARINNDPTRAARIII